MPYAAISPSEPLSAAAVSQHQRTTGELRIGFGAEGGATRLETLYQQGAARARLPNVARGGPPEAVLMNTAGGLTGGDRMRVTVALAPGADAVVTTQASEKIYRAAEGEVVVENGIELGDGAALDWLPQETILFDRSRLRRRLSVEMDATARLLAAESIVFGRTAMGETVRSGFLLDSWRVRRAGRLVYADGLGLDGAVAEKLRGRAMAAGGCAVATVLLVDPDAESTLDAARDAIGNAGGTSAWNGLLAARLVAEDGAALKAALIGLLTVLRRGRHLPRVWSC